MPCFIPGWLSLSIEAPQEGKPHRRDRLVLAVIAITPDSNLILACRRLDPLCNEFTRPKAPRITNRSVTKFKIKRAFPKGSLLVL
jgi:hypothetical protein